MVWLHCVWSIHKTWCYKVVLFDYQGFAPQQAFSLVDHVTTAFAYLKKPMQMNTAPNIKFVKFHTISTTTSLHNTAMSLTLRRLHQ